MGSKFCVAISGFKLLDPFCDPLFTPNYTTPTLHVLGRTDVVVVEERSRMLLEVSKTARLEEHDGGEPGRLLVMVAKYSVIFQDTLCHRKGTGASSWLTI